MNIKATLNKFISLLVVFTIFFSTIASSYANATGQITTISDMENTPIFLNNDSFVPIQFDEIKTAEIDVAEIQVNEILVNCIEVTGINNLEIEITTINDQFVYLAYDNFVSVYGDDFSLKDFLIDWGIGSVCILVCMTLSTASGPIGTFFGAIITSQFTPLAAVIGQAIDAAVAAYKAYQEGGDLSYILGHMLNGIADGFKWSAILAPLSGAIDGIKALRAVDELLKIPGFEELSDKEARAIFESLAEILEKSGRKAESLTDDAIRNLYVSLSKEITDEISEDILKTILLERTLITDIVRKFNPFNLSKKVVQAMRDNFLKRTGLSDDVGKQLIKQIQNGTIKSLDEITNTAAREFIETNLFEFVECFGESLSKDFIDNCLASSLGDDAFNLIKKYITSDDLYLELVKSIGRETADDVLSDTDTLILLQLRYGSKNVNRLTNVRVLYDQMLKNSDIPDEQLERVLRGFLDGSYQSLDEIADVSSQIARNISDSRELTAQVIKSLGNGNKLSGLLDDIAVVGLENVGISSDCAADIIRNSMSKADIISKYGDDAYQLLLSNYNFNLSINCIGSQNKLNLSLIRDMTTDALRSKGMTDDIIESIFSVKGIAEWGINDDEIMAISNIVADYYRMTDSTAYFNYIREISEKRGEYIAGFVTEYQKAGHTMINISFAGNIMEPNNAANPAFIKPKYGNIYMSSQGFPIFDYYAIARIEIPNLSGSETDLIRANIRHHGTSKSIPGYTWHHLEDGKTLILIPTDLHEAYRHTGGAALIREGLGG